MRLLAHVWHTIWHTLNPLRSPAILLSCASPAVPGNLPNTGDGRALSPVAVFFTLSPQNRPGAPHVQIVRPGLHHGSPVGQQFTALIRGPDLVPVRVGELALYGLTRPALL